MRRAARRDAVEPDLIQFARKLGAWLTKLDEPCDWLLFWRGRWELIEIKDPSCEGRADEYTPAQRLFRVEAHQRGAKLITWRTKDDVLNTLGGKIAA